ncbi:FHA domain-containing protein [Microcoleus sp. FACHB-1515]|uniref:FHA domain-containing protein n=1 Tax=Cyanophyceae TaxID=3028117 RepID=UPI0016838DA5|nr:FHA domain-containing protein [Microcoleus sp. FACHB-1515]MBD2090116.1 FHA domain-containing protein [Microcoleus sp. FACHB-1515]
MPHSNSSRISDNPLSLLEQSRLSNFLADYDLDPEEVTTLVEPVLRAKQRCQTSSFYIQAVTTGRISFLASNLSGVRDMQMTEAASHWLIGRSPNCAIAIANPQLSRRHAVIGYSSESFYITDVGSRNGTWVNKRRLSAMERQPLQDGDVIRLGSLPVEFFALTRDRNCEIGTDITCY